MTDVVSTFHAVRSIRRNCQIGNPFASEKQVEPDGQRKQSRKAEWPERSCNTAAAVHFENDSRYKIEDAAQAGHDQIDAKYLQQHAKECLVSHGLFPLGLKISELPGGGGHYDIPMSVGYHRQEEADALKSFIVFLGESGLEEVGFT